MKNIIIIQFLLSLFFFCNCKENSIKNIFGDQPIKIYEQKLPENKKSFYFTYKKWDSENESSNIYKDTHISVELKNYLDEQENIGGKQVFANNKQIDLIVTDAYKLTPYLFVDNEESLLLIQEEDESGIYGYLLYYFEEGKYIKKTYLNVSPVNQTKIDRFIKFKNIGNSIKAIILTDKYYDTGNDKIKPSEQYNFIFNKAQTIKNSNAKPGTNYDYNGFKFFGLWKTDCAKENISNILFNNEKEGYLYLYYKSKLFAKMMVELSEDKKLNYIATNMIGEDFDANKLAKLKKGETIARFETIKNNLKIFWFGFPKEKFLTQNPFGKGDSAIIKKCQ